DNQRGATIGETLNPLTGHESSHLGELFSQAALVFLLAAGGLPLFLRILYDSYALWPVFGWVPHLNDDAPRIILSQLDGLMRLAILLAAPVMIAMFTAEMGLALVSRFAPQLQVFFLAMPVKSGIAFFILAVYTTTLFSYGRDALTETA